jgi:hypothetical protein
MPRARPVQASELAETEPVPSFLPAGYLCQAVVFKSAQLKDVRQLTLELTQYSTFIKLQCRSGPGESILESVLP